MDLIFWFNSSMSGLWGYQTALDLFLKENGIKTSFFLQESTLTR